MRGKFAREDASGQGVATDLWERAAKVKQSVCLNCTVLPPPPAYDAPAFIYSFTHTTVYIYIYMYKMRVKHSEYMYMCVKLIHTTVLVYWIIIVGTPYKDRTIDIMVLLVSSFCYL